MLQLLYIKIAESSQESAKIAMETRRSDTGPNPVEGAFVEGGRLAQGLTGRVGGGEGSSRWAG